MALRLCLYALLWGLHESCGQTLLLATGSGVLTLEATTSELSRIHDLPASAVDFRYNKRDVYSISGNKLFYSYYSSFTQSYPSPLASVVSGHPLTDLVVDWDSFRLYYSVRQTGTVHEAPLFGSSSPPSLLFSGLEGVQDLAIDPYERLLFFIQEGTLFSYGLESRQSHQYQFESPRISRVAKVAVDHHTREVYVVGYDENEHGHLVSTDYNNTEVTLVFNGPELGSVFAVDVSAGDVLWGSRSEHRDTLYTCTLSPACDIDHLNIVYQSLEMINEARFYSAQVQTPSSDYACARLNCSHSCAVLSQFAVRCACPPGMLVADDASTCVVSSTPAIPLPSWTQRAVWLVELAAGLAPAVLGLVGDIPQAQLRLLLTCLVLACCVLMTALLLCGFCVLPCVPRPRKTVRRYEGFGLAERSTVVTNHHLQRLKTI